MFDRIWDEYVSQAFISAALHYVSPKFSGEHDPISGKELLTTESGDSVIIEKGIRTTAGNREILIYPGVKEGEKIDEDEEDVLTLVPTSDFFGHPQNEYLEYVDDSHTKLWKWDKETNVFVSEPKVYEEGVLSWIGKILIKSGKKWQNTKIFAFFAKHTKIFSRMKITKGKYRGKKILTWDHVGKKWVKTKAAKTIEPAAFAAMITSSLLRTGADVAGTALGIIWKIAEASLMVVSNGAFADFIGEEACQTSGISVWQANSHKNLPPSVLRNGIDTYRHVLSAAEKIHNTFGLLNPITYPSFDAFYQASESSYETFNAMYEEKLKFWKAVGPKMKEDAWISINIKGKAYTDNYANPRNCPDVIGVSAGRHIILIEGKGKLPIVIDHDFKNGEIYNFYADTEKSHYVKSLTSGRKMIIDTGMRIILDGVDVGDPKPRQDSGVETIARNYLVLLTYGKSLKVEDTGKEEDGVEIARVYAYTVEKGKIMKTNVNEEMEKFLVKYYNKHPEEAVKELDLSQGEVTIEGKVTEVTDGDTITVTSYLTSGIGTLGKYTIRFYGIDAPETGHGAGKTADYGGNKVKELLSWMIEKETVRVKVCCKDKYGRNVGTVYFGNVNICKLLVMIGAVRAFRKFLEGENKKEYTELEKFAKENELGIWHFPMKKWTIPDEIYAAKGVPIKKKSVEKKKK